MPRPVRIVLVTLVVVLGVGAADLTACGDKFLRFGRSARSNAYAAIHPASILLYVPAAARPSDVQKFESILKRAGHRAHAVPGMDAFLEAAGTNAYDIVIANYADAVRIRERAASLPGTPSLLPIVYKAKKTMLTEIQREYGHLLEEGAAKWETLAEIDHVMAGRINAEP